MDDVDFGNKNYVGNSDDYPCKIDRANGYDDTADGWSDGNYGNGNATGDESGGTSEVTSQVRNDEIIDAVFAELKHVTFGVLAKSARSLKTIEGPFLLRKRSRLKDPGEGDFDVTIESYVS